MHFITERRCKCAADGTGFTCPSNVGTPHPPEHKVITSDRLLDVSGRNMTEYLLYTTNLYRLHRWVCTSGFNFRPHTSGFTCPSNVGTPHPPEHKVITSDRLQGVSRRNMMEYLLYTTNLYRLHRWVCTSGFSFRPHTSGFTCPSNVGTPHPPEHKVITSDRLQGVSGRNMMEYLLYTTNLYRLHRWVCTSGFSFRPHTSGFTCPSNVGTPHPPEHKVITSDRLQGVSRRNMMEYLLYTTNLYRLHRWVCTSGFSFRPHTSGFTCPSNVGTPHPPEHKVITSDRLQGVSGRNMMEYLLYTTNLYRLHRWACTSGFSFRPHTSGFTCPSNVGTPHPPEHKVITSDRLQGVSRRNMMEYLLYTTNLYRLHRWVCTSGFSFRPHTSGFTCPSNVGTPHPPEHKVITSDRLQGVSRRNMMEYLLYTTNLYRWHRWVCTSGFSFRPHGVIVVNCSN